MATWTACGKKAPPLAPLVHVPAPVSALTARRVGDDVFLTFRIPAQNVDGSKPVDIASVDVLALTADAAPSRPVFVQRAKKIATIMVTPPAPAAAAKAAPPPPADAVVPGQEVVVHDTLAGDALVPVALPAARDRGTTSPPQPPVAAGAPGVAPDAGAATPPRPVGPRRYYVVVAGNSRQRSSPGGSQASVSIGAAPEPPRSLTVTWDERTVTLSWDPADPADQFNVYRDIVAAPASGSSSSVPAQPPVPLTTAPLDAAMYREPVAFGASVCYRVRALRRDASGELVEGRPSDARCERPVDTFPPAPPADVTVSAGSGEISIKWSANAEPDLGGYLVLRGTPGDDTLAQITPSPIKETRFVDRNVMSGVRYVYAVVAVDTASPDANRSAPSARDEATAR